MTSCSVLTEGGAKHVFKTLCTYFLNPAMCCSLICVSCFSIESQKLAHSSNKSYQDHIISTNHFPLSRKSQRGTHWVCRSIISGSTAAIPHVYVYLCLLRDAFTDVQFDYRQLKLPLLSSLCFESSLWTWTTKTYIINTLKTDRWYGERERKIINKKELCKKEKWVNAGSLQMQLVDLQADVDSKEQTFWPQICIYIAIYI